MPDTLTKQQRSKCMSLIRSKWTVPERKIHNYLKANKIRHKMHPNLPGKPDILLIRSKTAVFVHGCFWHKCQKCYVGPKSRKLYWIPKIARNVARDRKSTKVLRSQGYDVLIVWGHEIKSNFDKVIEKIKKYS